MGLAPPCRTLRVLLLLGGGLGSLAAQAADPGAKGSGPAWSLEADAFAHYEREVLERHDSLTDGYARWWEVDDLVGFHGYELDADRRRVVRPITHVELLYLPFVFTLPAQAKAGARRSLDGVLPGTWRLGPVEARGQVQALAAEPGDEPAALRLSGRVRLAGRGADPAHEPHRLLQAGILTWTARFDTARGALLEAEYALTASSVSGTTLRPAAANAMDARPQTYQVRARLRLARLWAHRAPGFQREVDAAIEDGLAHLESEQREDGCWGGPGQLGLTALVLLALVDGGRAPDAPVVERGFAWLLEQPPWAPGVRNETVYSLGMALQALERRRVPPEEVAARQRGEQPVLRPRRLLPREHAWASEALRVLLACATLADAGPASAGRAVTGPDRGRWRWGYPRVSTGEPRSGGPQDWDNSNTQYAVLGLESAARCGLDVPRHVWAGVARHFLAAQAPDGPERRGLVLAPHRARPSDAGPAAAQPSSTVPAGTVARQRGWCYTDMREPDPGTLPMNCTYGSMTAAGIASLAIARGRLAGAGLGDPELLARIDAGLRDGWASLDRMFDVWTNPRYEGWTTYWLYGLERAGMLADVERLGRHDWYWEGAVQLLLRRSAYGQSGPPHWVCDLHSEGTTAWAVLFLKRGTPPAVTPR